jgi:hypothetical protein
MHLESCLGIRIGPGPRLKGESAPKPYFRSASLRNGASRCNWIVGGAILGLTGITAAGAPGLTLEWNRNSEPSVAGYVLYYGTASGTYTKSVDAGNAIKATVPDLVSGVRYYFAVTAYDSNRTESLPSNEVSAVAPSPPTVAVTSLPPQQGQPLPVNAVVSSVTVEGRLVSINVSSPAQSAITIFASQSCSSWTVLGTIPNPTGRIVIQDLESPNFDRRYYRFSRVDLPAGGN